MLAWGLMDNRKTRMGSHTHTHMVHTYAIAHTCMGEGTHTLKGYFTQIAKNKIKNTFSLEPPVVSNNAASFGLICAGEISLYKMRQIEFCLWCSPVVVKKYLNLLL